MSQRRPIRRWIVRAGVFLLLGAIVNVAVAWGLVFTMIDQTEFKGIIPGDRRADPHHLDAFWNRSSIRERFEGEVELIFYPWARRFGTVSTCFAKGCILDDRNREENERNRNSDLMTYPSDWPGDGASYLRVDAGWPMHSLTGAQWWIHSVKIDSRKDLEHQRFYASAFESPSLDRKPQMRTIARQVPMPFGPLWPGFAINTLFYSAILWLLLAAPFALRRWRRVRRGMCPKCAYPVGESEHCTECGYELWQLGRL